MFHCKAQFGGNLLESCDNDGPANRFADFLKMFVYIKGECDIKSSL